MDTEEQQQNMMWKSLLLRHIQSDIAYPVLFYPDPSPSGTSEHSWLQIYSIRDASNITGVWLSGSLAYPDIFVKTDVCG